MLHRKDYKAIAQAINNTLNADSTKEALIEELCIIFFGDNPLYNAIKFKQACNKQYPIAKQRICDGTKIKNSKDKDSCVDVCNETKCPQQNI